MEFLRCRFPMSAAAESFIARWSQAEASERANARQFLIELADVAGRPSTYFFLTIARRIG
jgi:hypothetical protein